MTKTFYANESFMQHLEMFYNTHPNANDYSWMEGIYTHKAASKQAHSILMLRPCIKRAQESTTFLYLGDTTSVYMYIQIDIDIFLPDPTIPNAFNGYTIACHVYYLSVLMPLRFQCVIKMAASRIYIKKSNSQNILCMHHLRRAEQWVKISA